MFIEVKHRKKVPGSKLWGEVSLADKKEKKTPCIVFKEKGKQEELLMCRLKDLKKIAKEVN